MLRDSLHLQGSDRPRGQCLVYGPMAATGRAATVTCDFGCPGKSPGQLCKPQMPSCTLGSSGFLIAVGFDGSQVILRCSGVKGPCSQPGPPTL